MPESPPSRFGQPARPALARTGFGGPGRAPRSCDFPSPVPSGSRSGCARMSVRSGYWSTVLHLEATDGNPRQILPSDFSRCQARHSSFRQCSLLLASSPAASIGDLRRFPAMEHRSGSSTRQKFLTGALTGHLQSFNLIPNEGTSSYQHLGDAGDVPVSGHRGWSIWRCKAVGGLEGTST